MRLIKLIAFAALALGVAGCDQQVDGPTTTPSAAVQAAQQLDDPNERRLAYKLLSGQEKAELWTSRTAEIVSSANLTAPQRELVREFEAFMASYDGWGEDLSGERLGQVNTFRDDWLGRAAEVFTSEQVYAIAFDIQSVGDLTDGLAVSPPASVIAQAKTSAAGPGGPASQIPDAVTNSGQNCTCKVGSSFSCPYYDCSIGMDGFNCGWEYGVCSRVTYCDDFTPGGCGFAALYRCDGETCNQDGDRGPVGGGPSPGGPGGGEDNCWYNPGLPGCTREPVAQ